MKVVCPESSCRKENDALAPTCVCCGTPLQSYVQLLNHPAYLFNQGLARARNGEFEQARDLFAAVVHWCPKDLEARNALAMAYLASGHPIEAKQQWEFVLAYAPADALAMRGLCQIEELLQSMEQTSFRPSSSGIAGSLSFGKQIIENLLTRQKKD
jgi:tetratricopeptide (TPR) repeat protein